MIDEYDHFANELLGFRTDEFKELVAKNGKIRKWYEILKKGTESVVDRIFITGVAPITLDSTTSGFNIANDITKDIEFNDMLGFSKEDVNYLMEEIEIPKEKQEEYNKNPELLKQKQQEAKAQLERYTKTEELKAIPNLRSYAVVVIKDKIEVEEL